MLLLISAVWVLPELAGDFGWAAGMALMLAGFATLWVLDKFVYPICPSCSHTHDHDPCEARLHGFATPLLAASVVHSLFDGWTLAAAQAAGRYGISAGVLVHKVPESIAFGIILGAATKSRRQAVVGAAMVQASLLLGAALEMAVAPHIGMFWIQVLLAVSGGTFLYLGYHALHAEWKRWTAHRLA